MHFQKLQLKQMRFDIFLTFRVIEVHFPIKIILMKKRVYTMQLFGILLYLYNNISKFQKLPPGVFYKKRSS